MNIPPVLRSRTLETSPNPPHSQYTHTSRVAGNRIIRRREGTVLANPFANYGHPCLAGLCSVRPLNPPIRPNRKQEKSSARCHANKSVNRRILPQGNTRGLPSRRGGFRPPSCLFFILILWGAGPLALSPTEGPGPSRSNRPRGFNTNALNDPADPSPFASPA